jgi:chromate reductase
MAQPEAYVGEVTSMLAEDGSVVGESAQEFLKSIADAFVLWIERLG